MTFFPFGTLLRLIRLARRGSRRALICLGAFVAGLGLVIGSAVVGSTIGIAIGAVALTVGLAGSRPGIGGL
jgi:hypothetical protein